MKWPFIAIATIMLIGLFYVASKPKDMSPPSISLPSSAQPSTKEVNIKANFAIITDNITRSFKNPKYHNKSADVYIQENDPSIVYVKKLGVTWADFFNTLPMKLTNDCLVTGDGEKLCQATGSLRFYLNDVEEANLLDQEIKDGNKILIKYTSN